MKALAGTLLLFGLAVLARADTAAVTAPKLPPGWRASVHTLRRGKPKVCSPKNKLSHPSGHKVEGRVAVVVDPTFSGRGAEQAIEEVRAAYRQWAWEAKVPRLSPSAAKERADGSFKIDSKNTVSWRNLSPFSKDTLMAVQLDFDQAGKLAEFDIALDMSASWEEFSLGSVLTTAFGFVLGLGEVPEPAGCALAMHPFIAPKTNRVVGRGDSMALKKIYGDSPQN